MPEKTKKNYARGGGALLKKYGPDYFRKLADKKNAIDRKARALLCKTQNNPKTKLKKAKKSVRTAGVPVM